jgi:hypothetical protein
VRLGRTGRQRVADLPIRRDAFHQRIAATLGGSAFARGTHVFGKLEQGQTYTFTVAAHNTYGTGPPSPASNAVVP